VLAAEEHVRLDRNDSDALSTRAASVARYRDLETAIRILNYVAELKPDYLGILRFLARLYGEITDDRLAGLCLSWAILTG
jgi:hypothetical protein